MESLDLFGTNSLSSLGGGLGQSLLDSATLSTPLDDNSGLLALSQAFRTPVGTDPIASGLDHLSTLDTLASSNSANLAQDVAANSSSRAADAFDPFSLFKQPLSLAGLPSLALGSNSTTINNNTGRDPLTGMPNNTPIVGITGSDPLPGGFISSPLLTAPLPALSSDSVTSPPDISTPTIQSQGNVANTSGQNGSTSLVVPSSSVNNSTSTNAATTFKANSLLANTPSSSPIQTNLPSPGATLEGEFGNFGGQTDAQLTLNDNNGNPETFDLTGDGYGEVFKDSNSEQVVFTGIDATTAVQISATDNLQFGDYTGASLKVQTQGSITTGNIALKNTTASNSPGLSLQSGLSAGQNSASGSVYSITDLGILPGGYYSYADSINNSGQIVGVSPGSGNGGAFLYSNGQMTDLGTPPGDYYSEADAINDSGQVVGSSSGGSLSHAFLYSNGQMTDLGTLPGGYYSEADAINNSGQVVGDSSRSDTSEHAFLYSNGQMTDLGTLPGGRDSAANGINDSGQIVGDSDSTGNDPHAFLYSNGQMTDLGTLPGGWYSRADSINNSGEVVGESDSGYSTNHAFLYSNGQMADLGTLPGAPMGSYSEAYGINNSGQIVGFSQNSSLQDNAFLYSNGQMLDLNSLIPQGAGWTLDSATAINNKGQIVGDGEIGGQTHAFLLNPASTATPQDGITVGNISTQGDSIQLQGLKINLTGSQVSTKGGNITLDGSTILNSSTGATAVNSTTKSKSGDITLTNTLDSNSAGTSSLSLTAGQGNISFNHAVGINAALKDLRVNRAQTVTAKGDIITDGNTTILATQDITTGNLTSNSGAIKLTSKQGNVTTQALSSGSGTTITATQDVTTGNITTNGNAIELTSKHGSINTTAGTLNSSGATAGAITLSAPGNITTGSLNASAGASSTGNGGDITLSSTNGNIDTTAGTLNSTAGAGNGGAIDLSTTAGSISTSDASSGSDITLKATQDITTGNLTSSSEAIKLTSLQGAVTTQDISSDKVLSITAASNVTTHNMSAKDGAVGLSSEQGTITVDGNLTAGKSVYMAAAQELTTNQITSTAGVVGLNSRLGSITATGDITTNGDPTTFVDLAASVNVTTRNIQTQGGSIYLTSHQGAVTSGFLRSDGNGTGGDVDVQAWGLFTATAAVSINGASYSIYTGTTGDGSIRIEYGSTAINSGAPFSVGDATANGTAAALSTGSSTIAPVKTFLSSDVLGNITIINVDRGTGTLVADADLSFDPYLGVPLPPVPGAVFPSGTKVPFHFEPDLPPQLQTNPVTHDTYQDYNEVNLTEILNDEQRGRLEELIRDRKITPEDFRKGEEDEQGCYSTELDRHLGRNARHSDYATLVTGSTGDFLMVSGDKNANYAFYDGIVKPNGAANRYTASNGKTYHIEDVGTLAEVKTGGRCWIKVQQDQIEQLSDNDWQEITQTLRELYYQTLVAGQCGRRNFISFSDKQATLAAKQDFANRATLPGVAALIAGLKKRQMEGKALAYDVNIANKMLQPKSVQMNLLVSGNAIHYIPDAP